MSAAQIVAVEQLRAHLHRLGAHAQPCCDDCQKNGTTCGGAPAFGAAPSFGAPAAFKAPPPPTPSWPVSAADVKAYGEYVDLIVNALYDQDQKWQNAYVGEKSSCDEATLLQVVNTDQYIPTCYPQSWKTMQTEKAWAQTVNWYQWYQNWKSFNYVSDCTILCGSDLQQVQDFHKYLQWMCSVATGMGLYNVPDPGTLVAVPTPGSEIGKQASSNVTDLASGLITPALIIGAIYLGVTLVANKKKR